MNARSFVAVSISVTSQFFFKLPLMIIETQICTNFVRD